MILQALLIKRETGVILQKLFATHGFGSSTCTAHLLSHFAQSCIHSLTSYSFKKEKFIQPCNISKEAYITISW